jgi:hypothetical protein
MNEKLFRDGEKYKKNPAKMKNLLKSCEIAFSIRIKLATADAAEKIHICSMAEKALNVRLFHSKLPSA